MAILIGLDDFVGQYQFQFQNNTAYWENFITVQEELELRKLFGDALYAKLLADPADVDFEPIMKPYYKCGYEGRGLKTCLIALVYSSLVIHNGVYSPQGVAKVKTEVGSAVDPTENLSRAYNEGVYDAKAIRHQLCEGLDGLEDYCFDYKYVLKQYLW
jgi:hypothetical protein